jgi:hypothetical protein
LTSSSDRTFTRRAAARFEGDRRAPSASTRPLYVHAYEEDRRAAVGALDHALGS